MQKTIVVSEDGMFTSEPIDLEYMVNIFCAALNAAVQDSKARIDAAIADKDIMLTELDGNRAKKEIFDGMNHAFSKSLEIMFPEYEVHPELTEEVMQKVLEGETEEVAKKAKGKKFIPKADIEAAEAVQFPKVTAKDLPTS